MCDAWSLCQLCWLPGQQHNSEADCCNAALFRFMSVCKVQHDAVSLYDAALQSDC